MESDSVRTIGDSTLVDMWLSGKVRSISVSKEAIAALQGLPPGRGATLSDDERNHFVRTNLTLIAAAAAARLQDNPSADTVSIETGELRGEDSTRAADRRQGDRRKGDRRRRNLGPPGAERRRS